MINLEEYLDRKEFRRRVLAPDNEQTMDCKISRLPNELLLDIFLNHLNWNDQVRLTKVCRRFYSIIQSRRTKFNELAIFLNQFPCEEKLYFSDHVIDYSNTVCLSSLICLFVDDFKEKFKDIEYLLIVNNLDDELQSTKIDFNDNILNYFQRLRYVELRELEQIKGKLELPYLEKLYVSTRVQSNFTVSSPNLREVGSFGKSKPTLVHTKNLEHFAAAQLVQPFTGYGFLNRASDCMNLKHLTAYEPYQLKWVMNKFRDQLRSVTCINQLKMREISDLMKTANDLRLEKLTLYYFGIDMSNKSFKHLVDASPAESIFYVENLEMEFVSLFSRNLIDFQDSMPYIKEIAIDEYVEISNAFVEKLVNLRALSLRSTEQCKMNSKILLQFMDTSTKLTKLNLESIEIDQVHMNLLPLNFRDLQELKVKDCHIKCLDFINQFKRLEKFTTNCDLNVKQTSKLLLECCPVKIVFC